MCLRKTVRLAEQLEVPVVVTFSGLSGRFRDGDASQLGDPAVAAGVPRHPRLAVGEEDDSVLEPHARISPPNTA